MKNSKKRKAIYESNRIIEAYHSLTLPELRLIQLCLANIDQRKRLTGSEMHIVPVREYAQTYNIRRDHAYKQLLSAVELLFSAELAFKSNIFTGDLKDDSITMTRWISTYEENEPEAGIRLCWSLGIIPFISDIEGDFTKYYLDQVVGMSLSSVRLFRLLMQYKLLGYRDIEVEYFKSLMGLVEGTYDSFINLRNRIIDPAIAEINEKTDSNIRVEYWKKSRAISEVKFSWDRLGEVSNFNNLKS